MIYLIVRLFAVSNISYSLIHNIEPVIIVINSNYNWLNGSAGREAIEVESIW